MKTLIRASTRYGLRSGVAIVLSLCLMPAAWGEELIYRVGMEEFGGERSRVHILNGTGIELWFVLRTERSAEQTFTLDARDDGLYAVDRKNARWFFRIETSPQVVAVYELGQGRRYRLFWNEYYGRYDIAEAHM